MKNLLFNITLNLGFAFFLFSISSCVHEKDFVYFQNIKKDSTIVLADTVKNFTPMLRTGDLIAISVAAIDPDVVKPFNINSGGGSASTGASGGTATGGGSPNTYLIDANGMIDFPVLGALKLAGLNRMEATSLIKERVKAYVNNPIVSVRIQNFKITVLGEVKSPGVFNINQERITLPEALGLAGDLTLGGKRENVMVIRDEDGKKVETRVNLTSRDIFSSPVYYLNQNDVVYVAPTLSKVKSTSRGLQYGSIAITSTSLLINIINLFRK